MHNTTNNTPADCSSSSVINNNNPVENLTPKIDEIRAEREASRLKLARNAAKNLLSEGNYDKTAMLRVLLSLEDIKDLGRINDAGEALEKLLAKLRQN